MAGAEMKFVHARADYKVAIEKCDALSGSAKSTCISDAKLRYGKP